MNHFGESDDDDSEEEEEGTSDSFQELLTRLPRWLDSPNPSSEDDLSMATFTCLHLLARVQQQQQQQAKQTDSPLWRMLFKKQWTLKQGSFVTLKRRDDA
jgi:hypothetical protein